MSPPVGWALIGSGGWADHTFAPAVVAGGGSLLGAVGSAPVRSGTFAQKHGTPRSYDSLDEMLTDDDVEAVWIASPTHMHLEHALSCIRAGKHVLLEKPMALHVSEAEELVAVADRSSVKTAIGYQHRFNPAHYRLTELIRQGKFGKVAYVRLRQFVRAASLPPEWRRQRDTSGGWALNDMGTHLIDLLRVFVGELEPSGAVLASPGFGLDADDLAVLCFHSSDGVGIVEVATSLDESQSSFEIRGTEGHLVLTGSWQGGGTLEGDLPSWDGPEGFDNVNTYARQVEAFGRTVRGDSWQGATWEDGAVALRLAATAGS